MAYSLNNGTITQTGTDTDLSGLASIAGVDVSQIGVGTTGKTVYDIGGLRLVIDGTLSHDPDVEVLIGSAQNMLTVNGTYNYGVSRTKNGQTMYSESTGLISTFVSGNVFSQNGIILGGNFNWNGGDIEYASVISIPSSGVINQNAGGLIHKNPTQGNQIRISGGAVTNFNNIRVSAPNAATPRFFNFGAFDTLVFTPINASFQTFTQFISADVVLRDYSNAKNAADSDVVWNGQSEGGIYRVKYINAESFVACQPGNANLAGLTSTYKDYNFRVENVAGDGLDGAVIYYAEKDDGNTEVVNIYDLTVLESFAIESDSSGEVQVSPLVVNTYKKHGSSFSVVTNQRYNLNDTIPLQVWRYDRLPTSLSVPYYGVAGPSDINIVLFNDDLVTLSEAAVSALTEIITLDDLYDAAKYWKTRPRTERIEYPSTDGQLATLSGTALDLGSLNLVVDENATDVFSVDTTTDTITIKSSALNAGDKFDRITTTGTATGSINTPIIDANGDSYVEEAQGSLIRVYATEADRDNRTDALADLVSRYRFTFSTRPADTLYFWVKIGDAEFPTQLTLTQGENVVDLGTPGQLLKVLDGQRIINRGVQKASLLIPHTLQL